MDIPKFVGIVYVPLEDSPFVEYVHVGPDEPTVKAKTFASYNDAVAFYRDNNESESFIEQIGWDVYVSTRASANSPGAVHHSFEGPGA